MAIFKTETLKEKGLTQEQIDYIMAEAGREANALTAERDGYKNQLATAQASLKAMEGIDATGLQTKITDKYGEPVANADIEHRSGTVGFAYDEFVNLQSYFDRTVEVENYSEWNLPEYNAKIELFQAKSGEHEYVFIDYRDQK